MRAPTPGEDRDNHGLAGAVAELVEKRTEPGDTAIAAGQNTVERVKQQREEEQQKGQPRARRNQHDEDSAEDALAGSD